jgi:hypothetical protein
VERRSLNLAFVSRLLQDIRYSKMSSHPESWTCPADPETSQVLSDAVPPPFPIPKTTPRPKQRRIVSAAKIAPSYVLMGATLHNGHAQSYALLNVSREDSTSRLRSVACILRNESEKPKQKLRFPSITCPRLLNTRSPFPGASSPEIPPHKSCAQPFRSSPTPQLSCI